MYKIQNTVIIIVSVFYSPDSSSIPSYSLTKQELLALLEIIWQNNRFATFTDIISPDHYNKLDASFCFAFLLGEYVNNIF